MSNMADPLFHLAEVTPSNSADLPFRTRAVYIGVAGHLAVKTQKGAVGATVTLTNLPVGWHPISVWRIMATGTTATGIVAGE